MAILYKDGVEVHNFGSINTSDIVTTIDDTCTDKQVPSAKAVYDKLEEVF